MLSLLWLSLLAPLGWASPVGTQPVPIVVRKLHSQKLPRAHATLSATDLARPGRSGGLGRTPRPRARLEEASSPQECLRPYCVFGQGKSLLQASQRYSADTETMQDGSADSRSTFFGNGNEQIDRVCNQLLSLDEITSPVLNPSGKFDAIGFSQGGQFLRGLVERCGPALKVRNLITLGSQQ